MGVDLHTWQRCSVFLTVKASVSLADHNLSYIFIIDLFEQAYIASKVGHS